MHEQIENEYIIGLLQQRSQTIYNVHSDNKLSEMLSLFEKGLKNVKVSCTNRQLAITACVIYWYVTGKTCQHFIVNDVMVKKNILTVVKDNKEDFIQGVLQWRREIGFSSEDNRDKRGYNKKQGGGPGNY